MLNMDSAPGSPSNVIRDIICNIITYHGNNKVYQGSRRKSANSAKCGFSSGLTANGAHTFMNQISEDLNRTD